VNTNGEKFLNRHTSDLIDRKANVLTRRALVERGVFFAAFANALLDSTKRDRGLVVGKYDS
jgi:hypothetical protein